VSVDRPSVILECSRETLTAIRDGRQRALLVPSSRGQGIGVDFAVIFKHAEQTSSAVVTHVEQLEGEGMALISFARVWTHSSGDEYENAITLIEKACTAFRRLSHPGEGSDEEYASAARTLGSHCSLWAAIVEAVVPKKARAR
jgi:hypothetical protein